VSHSSKESKSRETYIFSFQLVNQIGSWNWIIEQQKKKKAGYYKTCRKVKLKSEHFILILSLSWIL
jgi:nicotinamide riboside transporter PnuC